MHLRQRFLSRLFQRRQADGLLRFIGAVLLHSILKGHQLSTFSDNVPAELFDSPHHGAIALRKDVEVFVARNEICKRFRGKHHFHREQRTALVNLDEPLTQYRALHLNFVLRTNEIRRRVLHFSVESGELLIQRMHDSYSCAVLTIQIVDFFGDVVRTVLQSAHSLLKRFALATNSRERILLRSKLCFPFVLRAQRIGGENSERDEEQRRAL